MAIVIRRLEPALPFLAGSAAGDVANQVWFLILGFGAASSSRPELAGAIIATAVAARAISAPLGGYLVDRLDPRRVLARASMAQAALYLLTALALAYNMASLPVTLIGCGVLRGLIEAIQEPNFSKIPPLIVASDALDSVAAVRQMSSRVALLLGAPAAGGIIALWGFEAAFCAAAVLTVAIVPALRVTDLRHRAKSSEGRGEEGAIREALGGLSYLRGDPSARALVVTLAGLNVFTAPITALAFPLIARQQGWGAHMLGIIMATLGVGGIVGALAHLRAKRPYTIGHAQAGLAVQAAGIAVAAIPSSLTAVLISSAVIGLTAGFSSPVLSATFQRTVKSTHLGRVDAVLSMVDDTLMPISLLAFGVIVGRDQPTAAILACAVGLLIVVLWHRTRLTAKTSRSQRKRKTDESTLSQPKQQNHRCSSVLPPHRPHIWVSQPLLPPSSS